MRRITLTAMLAAAALSAAIFGFFYAWVCSTLWGLDQADPRVAIGAMQAMNASVRNWVFAPAFFGTPFALAGAGWLAWRIGERASGLAFGAAGLIYLFAGMLLTMWVNVPMNEALGALAIPEDVEEARAIWQAYSGPWQGWNQARTVASGLAFLLAAWGLARFGRGRAEGRGGRSWPGTGGGRRPGQPAEEPGADRGLGWKAEAAFAPRKAGAGAADSFHSPTEPWQAVRPGDFQILGRARWRCALRIGGPAHGS